MSDRHTRTAFACLMVLAAALLMVNLDRYPAPWFDEGLNIGAASMLAADGQYALPDQLGPSVMDAKIQTGPTVILPVALLFRLLGRELVFARLVITIFALAALALYWRVSRRVFDGDTAIAASLCLLAGNREAFASFVYLGRQVLGEVPAFAMVLAGLLATLNGRPHPPGSGRRRAWAVAAGLAFGAAMVTKSQVFVVLPVALALVCAADLLYYRRGAWPALALSAGIGLSCVAGWYAIQYLAAGDAQFRTNAALARAGFMIHIAGISLMHMQNAAGVIWRTGFLFWGIPGLMWGLYLARTRDEAGLRQALLLALPLVALIWWVTLSIGWSRYAFYAFALLPMWTANGLVGWVRRWTRARWRPAAALLAGALLAAVLAAGAATWSAGLVAPPANGFEAMRRYLRASVPPQAVIETWEWELSLDASRQLRHPSTRLLYDAIVGHYSHRPPVLVAYSSDTQPLPDYVLDGPFGMWTGLYRDLIQARGQPVASFEPYTLYRIRRDDP